MTHDDALAPCPTADSDGCPLLIAGCPRSNGSAPGAPRRSNLLDTAGAAEFLATTERHIKALVYKRQIPNTKVGGRLRFDRRALQRWVDDQRREPL
jgi:excisionase family DNA binding protein